MVSCFCVASNEWESDNKNDPFGSFFYGGPAELSNRENV